MSRFRQLGEFMSAKSKSLSTLELRRMTMGGYTPSAVFTQTDGHPNSYELTDYAQGDPTPKVAAHVGRCFRCQQEARKIEEAYDAYANDDDR